MFGKNKLAIIAGVFFAIIVLVGAVVAVLVALKQNTLNPVAPTVPQIKPRAEGPIPTPTPTTNPACTLSFTVAGPTPTPTPTVTPTITPTPTVTYKYNRCEKGINNSDVCKQADCVPNNVPCSGLSNCTSDADCQPKYKHRVCLGSACTFVDCSPPNVACSDSCTSDANCVSSPPPPVVYVTPPPAVVVATHRECRNRACAVVSNTGTDTCSSDADCQPAAAPPPIPPAGNTAATIGAVVLGLGTVIIGLLILF